MRHTSITSTCGAASGGCANAPDGATSSAARTAPRRVTAPILLRRLGTEHDALRVRDVQLVADLDASEVLLVLDLAGDGTSVSRRDRDGRHGRVDRFHRHRGRYLCGDGGTRRL